MNKNPANTGLLYPKDLNMDLLIQGSPEEPFSGNAIAYLDALSLVLKKDPETRNHPDVATFAFFCRKANLIQLKKRYYPGNILRLGRGVVFHITPANVPVTFAYSLVSGILSGNVNIVKVSSKKSKQADIICKAICELGEDKKHLPFASRIALFSYDPESSATAYFSSLCDVRIIWGSDKTIEEIRKNSLAPHAFDVTFGFRYSLCVINAGKFISEKSPEKVASGFYNDTYLFDQNACTSPHLIVWLGTSENVETAKRIFWKNLHDLVKQRYSMQPHAAVDKLTAFYKQAVHSDGIKKTGMPDNLVWRTELKVLSEEIDKYRCNCGYFSEFTASALSELSGIISKRYQTLSYYGFQKEEMIAFLAQEKPDGIDSLVPVGRTLDFSLTRDGFNLIETLSREIVVL